MFDGFGYGHALACREAVGLNDDRCAAFADIGAGLIGVGEGFVGRGRHARCLHDFFGKLLAALQLCGGLIRAEYAEAFRRQNICHARTQRGFGTDNHQPGLVLNAPLFDAFKVGCAKIKICAQLCGSGISGRAEKLRFRAVVREFPRQRMLAPAVAYHQYFHRPLLQN